MGLSIQLADGQSVIAYENTSGVWFETADEASGAVNPSVLAGAVSASWIGLKDNADGGFAVAWAAGGALYEADYDSSGALVTAAHLIPGWTAPPAALAFTSAEAATPGRLTNGDQVTVTTSATSDGRGFSLQLEDPTGLPLGLAFVDPPQHMSADSVEGVTSLASGGYAVLYSHAGALLPGAEPMAALFDSQGDEIGSAIALGTGAGGFPGGAHAIAGLADGGFAFTWADTFSGALYLSEYSADGPDRVAVGRVLRQVEGAGEGVGPGEGEAAVGQARDGVRAAGEAAGARSQGDGRSDFVALAVEQRRHGFRAREQGAGVAVEHRIAAARQGGDAFDGVCAHVLGGIHEGQAEREPGRILQLEGEAPSVAGRRGRHRHLVAIGQSSGRGGFRRGEGEGGGRGGPARDQVRGGDERAARIVVGFIEGPAGRPGHGEAAVRIVLQADPGRRNGAREHGRVHRPGRLVGRLEPHAGRVLVRDHRLPVGELDRQTHGVPPAKPNRLSGVKFRLFFRLLGVSTGRPPERVDWSAHRSSSAGHGKALAQKGIFWSSLMLLAADLITAKLV